MRWSTISINPTASDIVAPMYAYDTVFENVEDAALVYFYDPPQKWAGITDCGNFPCTAPSNVLASFKRTTFNGLRPMFAKKDFQLIADNDAFAPYVPDCTRIEDNNAYICE